MYRRKIEAWTKAAQGELFDNSPRPVMIGSLVQRADGSLEQIDQELMDALPGGVVDQNDTEGWLLKMLHENGYENATLVFPWDKDEE